MSFVVTRQRVLRCSLVSKTQIRGPQRQGAHVLQPGDAAVVDSYASVPTDVAQREGQPAAAAILDLRRELWRLAERLVPLRLAAALRARTSPTDPTGRDGVRELRLAIADWLDPPPCCRWCRQAMREGDEVRTCSVQHTLPERRRANALRRCLPSKGRPHLNVTARCGTLALYPAGYADLRTMAAALACPKGAARYYDVAADRDGKALLAATAAVPPRDPSNPDAWRDEGLRLLHAAVAAAKEVDGGRPLPACVVAARKDLDAARNRNIAVNGRMGINVQLRYGAPSGGVTRADLTQGAQMGTDRAAMDYDAREARFTTYAAAWARQGVGEALSSRDLVDTPTAVLETRRKVEERLRHLGPTAARDLLLAIESVADCPKALGQCDWLVRLLVHAEVRENIAGTRPPRYQTRTLVLLAEADSLALDLSRAAQKPAHKRRKGLVALLPTGAGVAPVFNPDDEDPERARERVAAWVADRLELGKSSGPGLLAALRHGAPVFVGVGSGQDTGEDDGTQGQDGAGGVERRAAVLPAPDEQEAREEEDEDRARWSAALAALATLRGESRALAEVVRRHHGLDSVAEGTQGAGGESFAAIAEAGLASMPGKPACKETVRKMYKRGLDALRALCEGRSPDLLEDASEADDTPPALAPRSPWKTLAPSAVVPTVAAPVTRAASPDPASWLQFREAAAQVAW